jgi:hypothetical protein
MNILIWFGSASRVSRYGMGKRRIYDDWMFIIYDSRIYARS